MSGCSSAKFSSPSNWLTRTHTHKHTHTPHIIPTVFSILSPVPLLHPDSQIHSSLFHPSIALGVWGGAVAVIGEVSSHRHSVNFLSEGLVVTMQDKGKGEKRLLVFCHSYTTSQPFCALWCASHASFYNLCVCVVHPFFQVQTDPKFVCVCVCVCVYMSLPCRFLYLHVVFASFVCVCVCSHCGSRPSCVRGPFSPCGPWANILRTTLSLLIQPGPHTQHTNVKYNHTPHSQKDSFDSKHTKLAAKLPKCHRSIEEEGAGLESCTQVLVEAEPSVRQSRANLGL